MDSHRRARLALAALLVVIVAWGAHYIWRTSFPYQGERVFILWDDAMISMQYARNLPVRVDVPYEYAGFDYRWNEPGAIGGFQNDSFMTFDMRASYTIDFGPVNAQFFVDIFNLLDDQAATRSQDLVAGTGANDFGDAMAWVFPRRIYLGARLNF